MRPFLYLNLLAVKRDIHHPWAKSGSLCFCPPSNVITGLTTAFARANLQWVQKGTGARILEPALAYGSYNFDIFVLNRTAFLPCGEPLLVQATPHIIYPSGPSSAALPVWHQYVYNEQTGQLCSTQGHLILRLWSDAVSTIAVILNASVKLSHAIAAARDVPEDGWVVPSAMHALDAQIKEFLQQLYFSPPTATAARAEEEEDYEVLTPRSSADPRDEPGDDTEGDRDYNMDQDDGQDQDDPTVQPKGGNANYERTPQEALKTDITDDLEDDLEDDDLEEEDDEEALTLEEMNLGLKKLRDPSVAVGDKMDIGALMFVPRESICLPEEITILTRLAGPRYFRPSHGATITV
jgi:hypothetical protein